QIKCSAHDIHLVAEVKRTRVAHWPRYASNGTDRISRWIIFEGICGVLKCRAIPVGTTSRVDEVTNGCGRDVSSRDWQNSALLHPAGRVGRKLPNFIGH